ncbi:MAG: hypothetical protein JWR51_2150 [Devosia sp.]|nr:hypothetical protein [Devosia sp.]MDB5529047.1 hypothetical protein [Devosia sp.]
MSEIDPLSALFGLVGGTALGLTGIAVGPVITPFFLLLYIGFKVSGN